MTSHFTGTTRKRRCCISLHVPVFRMCYYGGPKF